MSFKPTVALLLSLLVSYLAPSGGISTKNVRNPITFVFLDKSSRKSRPSLTSSQPPLSPIFRFCLSIFAANQPAANNNNVHGASSRLAYPPAASNNQRSQGHGAYPPSAGPNVRLPRHYEPQRAPSDPQERIDYGTRIQSTWSV